MIIRIICNRLLCTGHDIKNSYNIHYVNNLVTVNVGCVVRLSTGHDIIYSYSIHNVDNAVTVNVTLDTLRCFLNNQLYSLGLSLSDS